MKKEKTVIAALVSSVMLLHVPAVKAGGGMVGAATEWTQLANNAELLGIYMEQVTAVQTALQQYQNMVQHTVGLTQQMWPSALVQISDLIDTISAVDSAANASVSAIQQFAQQYNNIQTLTHAQAIQRWRTGLQNQVAQSLNASGLNAARMRDSQSALAQIQAASQTAQGRMQVLQAGNQISGLLVNEIQGLHTTIIAAEQVQSNYVATKVRQDEEADRAFQEFMRDTGRRF